MVPDKAQKNKLKFEIFANLTKKIEPGFNTIYFFLEKLYNPSVKH